MNANPQQPSVASGSSTLPYLQFASILLNGLEKLAEIQKTAFSVYTEISRNSTDAIRQVTPTFPGPLLELAEQAIRAFLQIQVRLLDLMLSHSTARAEQPQSQLDVDYEMGVARLMRDSTDALLDMQKKAVEFITHQNQTLADELAHLGGNGSYKNLDDDGIMQHDTSAIIQAQKKFWDVTLMPFKMLRAEGSQSEVITDLRTGLE